MSKKNPEYDFKWCPGCGDFAVKRAIELAVRERMVRTELPVENNVIVAGIGCSGNLVHLLDGPQPFGIHGIHGRTLPVAMGIKMGNPELNVIVVAGDGDFLSIGAEHIGPQALRNLDVCAVIMDNGVYGLTKGQSSPTTQMGEVTPTTPFGKVEGVMNPLRHYLSLGVSYVASAFSSKPREMAQLIGDAMDYPGFAIVHVQSPCTTYLDTYDVLRGNAKKGLEPTVFDVPEDHDPADQQAALRLVTSDKIPLGLLFQAAEPVPFGQRLANAYANARPRGVEDQIAAFSV
jgi:2-oxoglutarate/2-oxoacid ferredoxin oxidoreductase subunit beta